MERATGIEPAFTAWEAVVLPMNYARKAQKRFLSISHMLLVQKPQATRVVLFLKYDAGNGTSFLNQLRTVRRWIFFRLVFY